MKFKIRCSQIGQIMTSPRSKTELLSKTTINYVDTWLKEQLYGRREFIETKAMRKGILCEDRAIEYASEVLGWGLAFKNKKEFSDEYMTGTPDVVLPTKIPDIKCPWSCFTFPLYEKEPDKNYWWQLQGYMNLTGKQKAELVYALMDLPDDMLDQELHYAKYRFDVLELSYEQREQVIKELTYEDLPDKLRLKVFEIERDQTAIDQVKQRVCEIRQYIKTL
jgi:hypothetical protein